jgi:threonine/homoserine/homoserine lactone efflux protein
MSDYLPWVTLALLGAYHGINPGMGWLFAVALGLQERSRSAVIGAFGPIAIGHAASVAVVVAAVGLAQTVVDAQSASAI